ncbi:MAG: hypothetical protein IKP28_06395 [Clostridia bacterium]|nr:hypothetical protein [Clostridia bacterium]
MGIASLTISCVILGYLIYKTMTIANKTEVNTYRDFLISGLKIRNTILTNTLNIIVTAFLGLSFVVMISGAGAYLEQEFNVPLYIGSSITCAFCMLIIASKTSGLVKLNMILIPILIFFMVLLGIFFTNTNGNTQAEKSIKAIILNPILYASYNSITLIPVLIYLKPLFSTTKSRILSASICAFILILLGMTAIHVLRRRRKYC